MVISPEMFNTDGDLSFLTYFSEPEPERAPWPTAVGGGYVIQYGGRSDISSCSIDKTYIKTCELL